MPRSYRHISDYENEILEMRRQGKTRKETCGKCGLSSRQVKDFITRYNRKQKKLAARISIKPKGRPRKDGSALPPSVQQLSKLTQLPCELAMKERHIKRLGIQHYTIYVKTW